MTVFVSGERLASELGVSHSVLLRLISRLRSKGVEVQGEAFTGFRLKRLPDVLLPRIVSERLHTGSIGRTLHHLYDVDSTNAYALRLIREDQAPHGTVVIAEAQSAGKGRRGRAWSSEPGTGLYMTIVLRPDISCTQAPVLTLGVAVAAHDAIERATGLEVDVKWPNDLLVGGRKVCGVLSELEAELDQVRSIVVGVGINVNQERFPPDIRNIATSLRIETGAPQSRIEILAGFLAALETMYRKFAEHGPAELIGRWSEASSFSSGRALEVLDGARRIRGVTAGLNPLGALRIRRPDGTLEEVYSGDVVHWE
jgi:BirA family biotin operon repressor/biotin-[acetyl-CoA-carboxylase] ligase